MNFVEFMATIRIPRYSRPLVAHLLLIYFGFSTSVLNGSYHSLCHSGVWVSGEGEPMAGDVHRPREGRSSEVWSSYCRPTRKEVRALFETT